MERMTYICDIDNMNRPHYDTKCCVSVSDVYDMLGIYENTMEEFGCETIQDLQDLVGYMIFSDGYDKYGNEVHKQEFIKYKDKFQDILKENKKLKKALTLAVNDKVDVEEQLLSEVLGDGNKTKISVPRKEQWYIEKASKESEDKNG